MQTDHVQRTGYSVILVAGTGHRAILTYRGAAAHLSRLAVPWNRLKTKWIYLTSVGGDLAFLQRLFSYAKRERVRIAWNPGNAELAHGYKKLAPFLAATHVLSVNREEAASLAERPARHLEKILKELACVPSEALLLTDGGNGAYVFAEEQFFFAPALPAKRVNTTGAGDAFGSGFLAEYLHSGDALEALRSGMLNATGVVTHMGAKAGILAKRPTAAARKRVKVLCPSLNA
jgi:ribokinase